MTHDTHPSLAVEHPNKELLLSADTLRQRLVALLICQRKGAAAEFRAVRWHPTGIHVNESRSWIIRAGSVLGVVLSLLFIGLELRQNTRAQRAETRQGLADASRDLVLSVAESDEAIWSYYGLYRDDLDDRPWPELSIADTLRARTLMYANLRNLENVFLQSLEGVVGEDALDTYGFVPSPLFASRAFARDWSNLKRNFDPRFVSAFERAVLVY